MGILELDVAVAEKCAPSPRAINQPYVIFFHVQTETEEKVVSTWGPVSVPDRPTVAVPISSQRGRAAFCL